jgi:hypothetical protein
MMEATTCNLKISIRNSQVGEHISQPFAKMLKSMALYSAIAKKEINQIKNPDKPKESKKKEGKGDDNQDYYESVSNFINRAKEYLDKALPIYNEHKKDINKKNDDILAVLKEFVGKDDDTDAFKFIDLRSSYSYDLKIVSIESLLKRIHKMVPPGTLREVVDGLERIRSYYLLSLSLEEVLNFLGSVSRHLNAILPLSIDARYIEMNFECIPIISRLEKRIITAFDSPNVNLIPNSLALLATANKFEVVPTETAIAYKDKQIALRSENNKGSENNKAALIAATQFVRELTKITDELPKDKALEAILKLMESEPCKNSYLLRVAALSARIKIMLREIEEIREKIPVDPTYFNNRLDMIIREFKIVGLIINGELTLDDERWIRSGKEFAKKVQTGVKNNLPIQWSLPENELIREALASLQYNFFNLCADASGIFFFSEDSYTAAATHQNKIEALERQRFILHFQDKILSFIQAMVRTNIANKKTEYIPKICFKIKTAVKTFNIDDFKEILSSLPKIDELQGINIEQLRNETRNLLLLLEDLQVETITADRGTALIDEQYQGVFNSPLVLKFKLALEQANNTKTTKQEHKASHVTTKDPSPATTTDPQAEAAALRAYNELMAEKPAEVTQSKKKKESAAKESEPIAGSTAAGNPGKKKKKKKAKKKESAAKESEPIAGSTAAGNPGKKKKKKKAKKKESAAKESIPVAVEIPVREHKGKASAETATVSTETLKQHFYKLVATFNYDDMGAEKALRLLDEFSMLSSAFHDDAELRCLIASMKGDIYAILVDGLLNQSSYRNSKKELNIAPSHIIDPTKLLNRLKACLHFYKQAQAQLDGIAPDKKAQYKEWLTHVIANKECLLKSCLKAIAYELEKLNEGREQAKIRLGEKWYKKQDENTSFYTQRRQELTEVHTQLAAMVRENSTALPQAETQPIYMVGYLQRKQEKPKHKEKLEHKGKPEHKQSLTAAPLASSLSASFTTTPPAQPPKQSVPPLGRSKSDSALYCVYAKGLMFANQSLFLASDYCDPHVTSEIMLNKKAWWEYHVHSLKQVWTEGRTNLDK